MEAYTLKCSLSIWLCFKVKFRRLRGLGGFRGVVDFRMGFDGCLCAASQACQAGRNDHLNRPTVRCPGLG